MGAQAKFFGPEFDRKFCPTCEQVIPAERLQEIGGKIAAKERERRESITSELERRFALERVNDTARAKAELDHERQTHADQEIRLIAEHQKAIEAEKSQAQNREKCIREEALRAARAAEASRVAEIGARNRDLEKKLATQAMDADKDRAVSAENVQRLTAELSALRDRFTADVARAKEELVNQVGEDLKNKENALAEANAKLVELEGRFVHLSEEHVAAIEENLKKQREILDKAKEDAVTQREQKPSKKIKNFPSKSPICSVH